MFSTIFLSALLLITGTIIVSNTTSITGTTTIIITLRVNSLYISPDHTYIVYTR